MDKQKIAHDIAIALLSKAISETDDKIYIYDNTDSGHINSSVITETYNELYNSVLEELS